MRGGQFVSEGWIILFGDYGPNTGPIDILAVSPTGVVTTLLAAFDTEETISCRLLDGAVYIPAVDPKTNTSARIATNQGGTWHTLTAQPTGVGVAVHLFDVALDPITDDLLACGSRGPDTAFVWRSTDLGITWTEDLAHNADGGGFNRFYEFRHDTAGRVVVFTTHGSPGYYVLTGTSWVPTASVTFDGSSRIAVDGPTTAVAPDGATWTCDGYNIRRVPA